MSNTKDYLKIYIKSNDTELINRYQNAIKTHNAQSESIYANAGFDLFCPEELISEEPIIKIDTHIICAMFNSDGMPLSYYLYPRSSVSKTNLRLANSVGIIDSGYRGNIIGMFDVIRNERVISEKYSRLLQICSPTLKPLHVEIANNINSLGVTERGSNGFGSSGV
uniref:dUTPase-like domain-containing protein n=1 Tax=viral metagenome TaxID=1070528 RepID=A0A6C0DA00_9ZZZZ